MSKPIFSYEEYDKVIDLYNYGLSTIKIANMYDTSHSVVRDVLIKCGVTLRDNSHKGRKYTIDESYFDDINTANKSYILGLLYADGCNYPPQRRVKIELQERDKSILEDINIEIKSNKPLSLIPLHDKNPNWQNTYRLDIVNKHISETLVEKGVVQNKSLILQPPECLYNDFLRDFIRGYFDGDGHIDKYFLNVASTLEMCEWIKKVIKDNVDVNMVIYNIQGREDSNTKLLTLYKRSDMLVFLNYLYNDSNLKIERKYMQYKELYDSLAV